MSRRCEAPPSPIRPDPGAAPRRARPTERRAAAPAAVLAVAAAVLVALPLLLPGASVEAQERGRRAETGAGDGEGPELRAIEIPLDTAFTTEHTVTTADGERIPYTATAGFLPVHDDDRKAVASLFYVYYRRSDVEDRDGRPLTFSFNGGPGSGSLWMHVGYTGPRRLRISDEGYPIQPYGVEANPHTILDRTDIVYVNPVNTGFSRAVEGVDMDPFFGVEDDVEYLADWIDLFVSREGRWASPKFLIGESYGTTRVSGLARELQRAHWMYVNGVILVSPTSLGIDRDGPVGDALKLPHYAATAWYHGRLPEELQRLELEEALLPRVEEFTVEEYVPALVRGGFLAERSRAEIAEAVARYAGVSEEFVEDYNLAVPVSAWRKELLRSQGYTVGRLDARYRGVDRTDGGDRYDYPPELEAWNHAFTPAIDEYLREELGVETDLQYHTFGPTPNWERRPNRTGAALREAMATNPFTKVMIQSGLYDGATDYFAAKYTLWQLDPSGKFRDRLRFRTYRSGHMMYLRSEDLATSNEDVRDFIEWSVPGPGIPARWPGRPPGEPGSGPDAGAAGR